MVGRSASGSASVNVEPSPSRDSTVTSPPWAWATWRTIDEPEAGAAGVAAAGPVDAVEALEDPLEVACRDPDAVVAHRDRDRSPSTLARRARPCSPRLGVLDRVVEQVGQRAAAPGGGRSATTTSAGSARPATGMPAAVGGAAATRSTASATSDGDRHRLAARRLLGLDEAEVEQVVDDARRAGRLRATTRSASWRMTSASSSAAIVSASSASAPIGVLSSWLTLATKSRRTLSTRRGLGDVADEDDRAEDLAVGR